MQFLSVTSFITRLPCKLYAKFDKIKNAYMNGNVIKLLNNVNSSDCAVACVSNFNCTLVNWKEDEMICELISDPNPQQISKDLWMILQPDNTNNKIVGQICEQVNPCGSTQVCRDVCDSFNKHTFSCISNNDVSRGATPTLSSTYQNNPVYDPYNTIDGDLATLCATDLGEITWFKLDLHYIYQLTQIIIYNRSDGYQELMIGNILIVSEYDQYLNAPIIATLTSDHEQIFTGSYTGRYIFIIQKNSLLVAIAEIYVYV
ncbi:uncharacterized protein LOC136090785 isoform X1 [Hydra vulgaris]|uniref:Uncharacterized protein LOC136090785 isoform X1 n=2 Tax=Hydra vulgaris TaxID=6087 RepID=A0ABM4DH47_HYDVU